MSKNKNQKNIGPIIGTLIVIIVVIVVALYMFASNVNHRVNLNPNQYTGTIQNSSDRPDDMQTLKNDLNNAIK